MTWQAKFEGRKRFQSWRVTCQTPNKTEKKVGISKDNNVPIARFKNVTVDNSTVGDIQNTADWVRSKSFKDALTIPFPQPSWFDPNGNLFMENTIVTVRSITLGVPNGFNFLIRQVDYTSSIDGDTCVLHLVPPQVYTGEVIVEPWRS